MRLVTELLAAVPNGRRRFALATVLAALASMSSVALMGTAAWLISFAALTPPVLYLQAAAVLVRAFGIARGSFRYVERLVGHDLVLRMQSALRIRVYDKLAGTTLVGRRRGDLLTRVVADLAAIQDVVVRVVIPVLSASLVVTATTIILATFNLASALVMLATALLGGVVVPLLAQRASQRIDLDAVPTRGRLADQVREFSRTAQDLVAYGATDQAIGRVLEVDEQLRRQEARGAWVRGIAGGSHLGAADRHPGGPRRQLGPPLPGGAGADPAGIARGAQHLHPGRPDVDPMPGRPGSHRRDIGRPRRRLRRRGARGCW